MAIEVALAGQTPSTAPFLGLLVSESDTDSCRREGKPVRRQRARIGDDLVDRAERPDAENSASSPANE
jgi:hypothetical protein